MVRPGSSKLDPDARPECSSPPLSTSPALPLVTVDLPGHHWDKTECSPGLGLVLLALFKGCGTASLHLLYW